MSLGFALVWVSFLLWVVILGKELHRPEPTHWSWFTTATVVGMIGIFIVALKILQLSGVYSG